MRNAECVHRPRTRAEPLGERTVALVERRGAQRECGRVLPRRRRESRGAVLEFEQSLRFPGAGVHRPPPSDRKSTRLNSSHLVISYAVFCLKKKKIATRPT